MSKMSGKFTVEIEGIPKIEMDLNSMCLPKCKILKPSPCQVIIEGLGEFNTPLPEEIGTITVDVEGYHLTLGDKAKDYMKDRFDKLKQKTLIRIRREIDIS